LAKKYGVIWGGLRYARAASGSFVLKGSMAPMTDRLLIGSPAMDGYRLMELAPIEDHDTVQGYRALPIRLDQVLDKRPRQQSGAGGKPDEIAVAAIDRPDGRV
jgi:hypothetical protein